MSGGKDPHNVFGGKPTVLPHISVTAESLDAGRGSLSPSRSSHLHKRTVAAIGFGPGRVQFRWHIDLSSTLRMPLL